jgi:adenosine deaminase
MVRNSLEYSFLPGTSYWQDRAYRAPVAACAGGAKTKACRTYLDGSEKARIEADLEDRFRAFEHAPLN